MSQHKEATANVRRPAVPRPGAVPLLRCLSAQHSHRQRHGQTIDAGIVDQTFPDEPHCRDCFIIQLLCCMHRPMRFDMGCEATGIENRLTEPNHPWSREDQKKVRETVFPRDGQVKRIPLTV